MVASDDPDMNPVFMVGIKNKMYNVVSKKTKEINCAFLDLLDSLDSRLFVLTKEYLTKQIAVLFYSAHIYRYLYPYLYYLIIAMLHKSLVGFC